MQCQRLAAKPKTDNRFYFVNFSLWFFHIDCSQIMPVETAPFAGKLPATRKDYALFFSKFYLSQVCLSVYKTFDEKIVCKGQGP